MRTYHEGSNSLVDLSNVAYYFSVKGSSYGETNNVVNTASTIVRPEPMTINGGFKIITEGDDNKFPYQLRQLIDDNNLTEGILTRQRGLQYGQGLAMYNIKFEQGKRIVDWFWDDTIGKELELWDYPEYIINVLMDIIFKREYYTMMIANRGARIGRDAKAVGLKHMPLADCRREWPDDRGRINNVFVADWRNGDPEIMERYPMFDPLKGINQTTSIHYEALYQPGRSQVDFVRPGYHGARKWMQRSNVAPDILKSQTDNGLNIKWHIISPQSYWDAKRTILIENCKQLNQFYKEEMLEELKDKILTGLSKVLSGIENVGKFFHSEAVQVELGVGRAEVMKWELIAIDMKVKDFTEAQIQISKRADSAITSGAGLAPSLANIIVDGKLASGSEKLYDYKLFIATETPVIGMKALKALNMWKRMRFPNIPGEFGLYHDIVKREEDLASAQRTTNNES